MKILKKITEQNKVEAAPMTLLWDSDGEAMALSVVMAINGEAGIGDNSLVLW